MHALGRQQQACEHTNALPVITVMRYLCYNSNTASSFLCANTKQAHADGPSSHAPCMQPQVHCVGLPEGGPTAVQIHTWSSSERRNFCSSGAHVFSSRCSRVSSSVLPACAATASFYHYSEAHSSTAVMLSHSGCYTLPARYTQKPRTRHRNREEQLVYGLCYISLAASFVDGVTVVTPCATGAQEK